MFRQHAYRFAAFVLVLLALDSRTMATAQNILPAAPDDALFATAGTHAIVTRVPLCADIPTNDVFRPCLPDGETIWPYGLPLHLDRVPLGTNGECIEGPNRGFWISNADFPGTPRAGNPNDARINIDAVRCAGFEFNITFVPHGWLYQAVVSTFRNVQAQFGTIVELNARLDALLRRQQEFENTFDERVAAANVDLRTRIDELEAEVSRLTAEITALGERFSAP